ncbi:MAG: CHAT domain-containing protein [Cyanobacteria bacterium J06632_22]
MKGASKYAPKYAPKYGWKYAWIALVTMCLLVVGPMPRQAISATAVPSVVSGNIVAESRTVSAGRDPWLGRETLASETDSLTTDSLALVQQGKQQYQNGQIAIAIRAWQRSLLSASDVAQVQIYRYLSIAYQDLGQWEAAETALSQAFQRQGNGDLLTRAQLLNTRGRLQLLQGQPAAALNSWERAEELYQQLDDGQGLALSQINQAQALRSLGHYRRARLLLTQLAQQIDTLDHPALKAALKRSLGSTLIAVGDLDEARQLLLESLTLDEDAVAVAATHYQLGRVYQALEQTDDALRHFDLAAHSPDVRTALESQLAELRLQVTVAPAVATRRVQGLRSHLLQLPPSRWTLYGQINLAKSWAKLAHHAQAFERDAPSIARLLAHTVQQSTQLQDARAEALALVSLGHLYEQTGQVAAGLSLTEQAIAKARPVRADDLLVKAQWQQGRLLTLLQRKGEAITAYSTAVRYLQRLRQDLVAMNPDVQFSFRAEVEPIYRELAQLLLENVDALPFEQQQRRLNQARDTIELLQLAELQNFFREACRTYTTRSIEAIDPNAAVVYSIVLGQRLEVIFSRPGQPLQHHYAELTTTELTDTVNALRQTLNPAFLASESQRPAQKIYRWLVQPFERELQSTDTLVFVLDDFLRDIPMAVLHDGQHYLIENYAVVLTPGLQLFESAPLQNLTTFTGGLTQARQGFSALPGVADEIAQIRQKVSATALLDQQFTRDRIRTALTQNNFSIVHLGTHGQFSSRLDQTFLLTWESRLGIQDLRQWLPQYQAPLELLILSACQTAKGDDRATLGLAGLTLQAGARSAIATLWAVEDRSTATMMTFIYDALVDRTRSRAEVLRQAQLQLLHSKDFAHPYHWAGFALVGNWM